MFSSATSIDALTAISMVATPHWGACSLSVDLTSFEISATGGRKRFAHAYEAFLPASAIVRWKLPSGGDSSTPLRSAQNDNVGVMV